MNRVPAIDRLALPQPRALAGACKHSNTFSCACACTHSLYLSQSAPWSDPRRPRIRVSKCHYSSLPEPSPTSGLFGAVPHARTLHTSSGWP